MQRKRSIAKTTILMLKLNIEAGMAAKNVADELGITYADIKHASDYTFNLMVKLMGVGNE